LQRSLIIRQISHGMVLWNPSVTFTTISKTFYHYQLLWKWKKLYISAELLLGSMSKAVIFSIRKLVKRCLANLDLVESHKDQHDGIILNFAITFLLFSENLVACTTGI
jgi:hypothetical protein